MVYKKCKLRFPEKKDLTVIGELAMRRVSHFTYHSYVNKPLQILFAYICISFYPSSRGAVEKILSTTIRNIVQRFSVSC